MDLWCMVPFYDAYLCEALRLEGIACVLGSISFHLEPDFFRRRSLQTEPGFCDVVSGLRIRTPAIRQALKLLEFLVNILSLTIRILFAPPDIIHVQWLPLAQRGVPIELWFLQLAKRLGVKVVYTVHNVLPHDSGEHDRPRFRQIYGIMDALVCHTRDARKQLISNFRVDEHKIWVIPHGPLFHDFTSVEAREAKGRLGLAPESRVVLCQGNLKRYKGIEFLLQAWTMVHAHQPDATLLIAGSGEKQYLDSITKMVLDLGIDSSVRLVLHYIPSEQIPLYYQACDLAVYTHREITQSGALLTGVTFSKTIVATSLPGFQETLENYPEAFTVDYGNAKRLADVLTAALKIGQGTVRSNPAFTLRDSRMSWESIARQTRCCYDALLSTADCPRPVPSHN